MANGKAQTETTEDAEWGEFKTQIAEFTKVFGSLLFSPVILVVGIAYGLRAGLIAGGGKAISMFQDWGK